MADASYYIGLMSGTSMDGIDAVLVDLGQKHPQLLASHSHTYPEELLQELSNVIQPDWRGSLASIGTLHQQLGKTFADAANQLIKKSNIAPAKIEAIGSHGQTVWHQPQATHPFSLQLGDGNQIAERTGITTVADFRSRDIAAAGQGAPLVPAFHREALSHATKNRVILNIGGIANITLLPAGNTTNKVSGFDTGPGNGLMDAWINQHKNTRYDENGDWATSGEVLSQALNHLLNEPYFALSAPKSTGKELFNLDWLRNKLGDRLASYKPEDIQATLAELTAKTIADSVNNADTTSDEVFVCGGGVHNPLLMGRLRYYLPRIPVCSTATMGIDPDWMEAIAFAWLAKQTLQGKAGNLASVTGAKGARVLGAIYHK